MSEATRSRGLVESLRALVRHRTVRDIAILTGGTGGGQVIVLAVSPLLTRLYSPADFGLLAAYIALLSPLLVIGSLRYEYAVPLPERSDTALALVALGVGLISLVGLCAAGVVYAFTGEIEQWLQVEELGPVRWLLPLGVVAAGGYQVISYWAVRTRSYTALARTKVSQGALGALSQVAFGLAGWGPAGLIGGDVVGRASGTGTLATQLVRDWKAHSKSLNLALIRAAAHTYRRFPLLAAPAGLLNTVSTQFPALYLAGAFSVEAAGWYALTNRVIAAPVALLGTATAQVYLEKAARTAREQPTELRGLYVRGLVKLLLVGSGPLVLIGLVSPFVFPAVFGEEWVQAGWFVAILALPYVIQFAVSPLNQMLNVIERQDLQLKWNVLRAVLVIGGMLLVGAATRNVMYVVAAYGLAMAISYAINVAITLHGIGAKQAD